MTASDTGAPAAGWIGSLTVPLLPPPRPSVTTAEACLVLEVGARVVIVPVVEQHGRLQPQVGEPVRHLVGGVVDRLPPVVRLQAQLPGGGPLDEVADADAEQPEGNK